MKKRSLILIVAMMLAFTAFAQKRISGVVVDTQKDPLPGVSVVEKGTLNGIVTDIDGKFTLSVAGDNSVVVFSFVGMKNQEIAVGAQSTINVVLESDMSDLDEVVVVGYGVQKKKLVTGANLSVNADELQRQNSTEALDAIQSISPGVNITQGSGMPGEGFKVNIRGLGTIGNSAPLYVIDGVAGGDINTLNPSDIESIDVLKDAASAAIYGARAANGVILVTTKGGRKGRTVVTYDGFYGVQDAVKMPGLLNAKQFMEIYNEERVVSGKAPVDFATVIPGIYQDVQNGWQGTNWMEEIRNKNAPIQNHSLNISGGSETSVFALGFSYSAQEGIFGKPVEPKHDRYTVRLNSDHVLYEKDGMDVIKIGETMTYSFRDKSGIAIGGMYYNDIRNMLQGNPLVPVYNSNGEYFARADVKASGLEALSSRLYNPKAQMELNRGMNETLNYDLNSSAYLQIQPMKDLIFKSSFGYKMNANAYRSYQPAFDLAGDATFTPGRITQTAGSGYSWTIENTLSYKFKLDQHAFDVVVGQSAEKWGYGSKMEATNANPTFIGFDYAYLNNTDGLTTGVTNIGGQPNTQGNMASFFGRVNYNFNEKYLLTLVMRADGSSNFNEGKRWGTFPSVSAGWVITEEGFMANNGVVDFLKLRASWGQNGNADITALQYLSLIAFDRENNYTFGNDRNKMQLGGYPAFIPNPYVSWETSEQLNIGFDAYFLGSRLQTAFDYYTKTTKDWLVRPTLSAVQGPQGAFVNAGEIINKGIELALRWNDNVGAFSYGAQFNISKNDNEVTKMGETDTFRESNPSIISQGTDPIWRVEKGYPVGYFRGYKTEGIFQNAAQIANWKHGFLQENPQPGDVIFSDVNGDGKVNTDDKTMIGNPHPDFRIGFGVNFAYKGFDFSLSGKGAFGQQILQSYRSFADNEFHNYTTDILGRWHGEGTSNKIPRMTAGNGTNRLNISELYIEDGDYIKIQNVTLGYDFKKLLPKLPMSQARLYVAGRNLWTFTDYSGMDPEVGYGDDQPFVQGVDLGFYPSAKTYLVGLNLKF
ncbi:TonB-linked SusC/RagA family outer membrane protein [Breznakibacter xylanolyticus]|uniref:TonB-linked SusC/RagA family outer membrane protein n=1 Tax=Breznakibacter xylanolyticus TaxID=990 RepID=A0A2W7MWC1_9BACT|nr:TonB-dependent receptor [Breznakibacter xylanolyticus]PZX11863.1 TonB-linked SusC/RagA family outer membrane protein [Breznakibacter xylanolyticus]